MPRPPARRGPDPLTHELSFQVLDLGVRISTEDDGIARILSFVGNEMRHPSAPRRTVAYEVREGELVEDGEAVARIEYPVDALLQVMPRLYARATQPFAGTGAALLYAGCARVGAARILVVGDEGPGRTALLTRLMLEGMAVEGDWCVVVSAGAVTPVARPLHIDQAVIDRVPGAQALTDGRPFVQDALLRKTWAVDPGAEIQRGAVDDVVVVESRDGGRSRLEPQPQYEAAQEAVAALGAFAGETDPPVARRIAAVCEIVNRSATWRLQLGDLDEAMTLLGSLQPA